MLVFHYSICIIYNKLLLNKILVLKKNYKSLSFFFFNFSKIFWNFYSKNIRIFHFFLNNLKKSKHFLNLKIFKSFFKVTGIGWRHWIFLNKKLLLFRVGHNFLFFLKISKNIIYKNINRYFFKLLNSNLNQFNSQASYIKSVYPTFTYKNIGIRDTKKKVKLKKFRSSYLGLRK